MSIEELPRRSHKRLTCIRSGIDQGIDPYLALLHIKLHTPQ